MVTRREFLRGLGEGWFRARRLLGLGVDLRAAQAEVRSLKIANGKEVPSVCPYCAVGCGQLVSVRRTAQDRQHRGQPRKPHQPRHPLPQGGGHLPARRQPQPRHQGLVPRPAPPSGTRPRPLDWAMDRIAELVKKTRDEHLPGDTWISDPGRQAGRRSVNHTLAIASLGGATMDNEWNYVQAKLMRALGVVSSKTRPGYDTARPCPVWALRMAAAGPPRSRWT